MSASPTTDTPITAKGIRRRTARWIDEWEPENPSFWQSTGRKIAQRNLWFSIFAEFLGFAVWALWSIVVPRLGDVGFTLTTDQKFWLIAIPSLVGATLRIPYTLAVPIVGGRNWTIISATLLLLPTASMAWVVQHPETSFGVLMLIAALAGFGGGNFASSMANISFFFPEAEKGKALGLNAAGGNVGTAAVQFAVPIVIALGAGLSLERAGLMWIPLILLSIFFAWKWMDNLSTAKANPRTFAAAVRNKHTWIISFLYIGTFGSFIGYSGAFPTLLKDQFPEMSLSIAFMGALVGSVSRPFGGSISDKLGGARVTIASYFVMCAGAFGAIWALDNKSFPVFFTSFLILFIATGIGNGATYRMIPAVFQTSAAASVPDGNPEKLASARSLAVKAAAGCLGIGGAVGALGGFLIPRGFAVSTSQYGSLIPALWVFIGIYLVMAFVCWWVYARKGTELAAARI